jgi:hypothetical protein
MTMPPKRRADLARRLVETNHNARSRCWVFQCPEPPGNTSGKGLGRFCRRHLEHYRRHGDPLKASYSATRTKPYRKAAATWIECNAADRFVQAATKRIEGLMIGAGQAIAPRNLRGVNAKDKARSVWARLRNREVAATDALAAILAVVMCHAADPQRGRTEYLRVQIAKTLSRMAGGEIKRWPTHFTDPTLPKVKVLRWFPASEGLVLRELGKTAEVSADFIIAERMEALLVTVEEQRIRKTNRTIKVLTVPHNPRSNPE